MFHLLEEKQYNRKRRINGHNLSVHKALKNSPYSVLFGVDANTPLNHTGFVTKPIYGPDYQHTMGNRLQLARKLAKSNNMELIRLLDKA